MKKIVAIFLAVLLVLSFTSCKGNEVSSDSSSASDSAVETSSESSDIPLDGTSSLDERYTDMVARDEVALTKMYFGKVFYRPKQVAKIYLIDISEEDSDTVAMLYSLQGVVARNYGGAIYLDDGSDSSRFWVDYCSTEYGLNFDKATAGDVIKNFARYIKGAVLYSEDVSYEYTVAINMAIQSDYLVATGETISLINPVLSNKPLLDIRNQFSDKKSAYNYIIENCIQTSSTRYLGLMSKKSAFLDYAYAVKALVVDFDFTEEWEAEMFSFIIGRPDWNQTAYVFSDRTATTALQNAFSTDGFSIISVGNFYNCTMFSSVSANYNTRTRKYDTEKLNANKIYVSMYLNVESMADVQKTAYTVWNNKTSVSRISVEYFPVLYEIAPPIAKWYRQNHTSSDMLISADLGCGSANLSLMDQKTAELFKENNRYFLNACGITVMTDGTDIKKADDYDEELNDLLGAESETTITAKMRFSDQDSLESWLNTAVPVSNEPMYFLIELQSVDFDGEEFADLGSIISKVQRKRVGVFQFVLTENLLEYM